MSGDARDVAARALLQLINYGPDKRFPHPNVKYREALAVVDALQAMTGQERAMIRTPRGSRVLSHLRGRMAVRNRPPHLR